MLKARTKVVTYGSKYSRAIVIPASVRKDSAYPFGDNEKFEIEIKGNTLVMKKQEKAKPTRIRPKAKGRAKK